MTVGHTQPPVGYRYPLGDLARALRDVATSRDHRARILEPGLANAFGVRHAFGVSSGKAALTLILLALSRLTARRKVIVPAYTCYSVPSAVLKAGLEIVPCDLATDSFDYDYDRLGPLLHDDVLCALSVHLFGVPSDTTRLRQLCASKGIFVVEDAAQAMGCTDRGRALGTQGDAGFFSLGRGKNVTCGSGGIIVTSSPQVAGELAPLVCPLAGAGMGEDLKTAATLLLLSAFISPRLYWFPAGLPFLRLGETIFHEDFAIRRLSEFEALLLRGWQSTLSALNAVRREHGQFYAEHIAAARGCSTSIAYLRFPLTLDGPETRSRLLVDRNGRALGMTSMYPTSVARIPQLGGRLNPQEYPTAERLAASLVTLPTHPLLSEKERMTICTLVNETTSHLGGRTQAERLAS